MKLLIVGFNARPLAQAAKQAGHTIGVCDYFGDMDLTNLTNNCFSVLRQKPNEPFHRPLHRKPPEYLFHLAKIMIEEQGNFDGVLIASGFDNYPNIIEKFYRLGPEMFLNKPEVFREVRNFDKISSLARSCGFKIPKTTTINTFNELITIDKEHTFPLVTRSKGGGGGKGIKLWENKEEFLNYF
ncbi:MAG: hypothetical protein U9O98_01170, partial [Asgard group archaeon]|nr:hypothetical protein [Asgard group archaeon]